MKIDQQAQSGRSNDAAYLEKIRQEQANYRDVLDVNALPPIFHYWSHTYLRPIFEEFGIGHPDNWFAQHLVASAHRTGSGEDVLAFRRGPLTCVLNCGTAPVDLPAGQVLMASGPVDGSVPADTAAWLV